MITNTAKVSIIMGSDSDLPIMQNAMEFLDKMDIKYEVNILSVHRNPEEAISYAKAIKGTDIQVIIAGAGGAAHLPGIFAAYCDVPVIGVPIETKSLSGVDSLYSIVQMPSGIPVATVGINNSKNAAILATKIIALNNTNVQEKLSNYKRELEENVSDKNEKINKIGYKQYLREMNGVN